MTNKTVTIIITVFVIIGIIIGGYFFLKEDTKLNDAKRFATEYTKMNKDNLFVYKSAEETIEILEKGTGIVYLGFPECPWCQFYVVYLNEVAKELGIEKIYYFNISSDRNNNSENYKKIMSILDYDLQYDDEGNPRIYTPDISVVKNGKIIGRDYETSKDTLGYDDPNDYWTPERINNLKETLKTMIKEITSNYCDDCIIE